MRGALRAYSVATVALVAAVLLRWLLDPLMGDTLPLVTLFGAVAVAVWIGGWRPALVVTLVGYVACSWLFIAPRGELRLDLATAVGLVAYLFTCTLIVGIGEAARHAQAHAGERETARLLAARLLASIVESSDDAIVRKTLDGTIQSWNAGAERLFGYSADEAVGRHISLIIPADRLAEEDRIVASLRAGRRVEHFETERLHKSGALIEVSLTISPIFDEEGNVVGASKIARDVTQQHRAEAERQKLVTLVENTTDFIGMCDLEGVPFYVNPAGLRMVGLDDMEQARLVNVRDFFLPEDQPRIIDELFPAVLEQGHGEMDVRFRNFKTGATRWMAYKLLTLTGTDGRPEGYATVSQDVTDRRRMEDDLRKLAADLSAADRQKNEFLATLAHELRNPLAPLSNMLEVLKRFGGDPAARPRALDTMDRQLGHLVRLVDDLLDLSRVTHNRLELRKVGVELEALIDQAVEAVRPLADAAGHEVRVIAAGEPIYLRADPVRLAQVFGNLLNNSCKYTSPGGKVTVRIERHGDEAMVTVEDTGAGIPPDKLDSIFDMFSQVEDSLERSGGGLGIGLTLVRRLVQMHGGSVAGPERGGGSGERVRGAPAGRDGRGGRRSTGRGAGAAAPPARPRRILVVDDNRDAADSLAMLLDIAGHQTFTAHDGAAAVEAVREHRPDVVLLDIGLPILNGYEVCRQVRAEPWGEEPTIVALTGWGQEEDRHRSREAGFDGHLVKPVDYAALTALLGSLRVEGRRPVRD